MRFRVSILILALVLIPAFSWLFWQISQPETISESLESFGTLGDSIRESVTSLPAIAPAKADSGYTVKDEGQNAIKISYANEDESQKLNSSSAEKLSLSFPKDPSKGSLEVKLPSDKTFSFQSLESTSYTSSVVTGDEPVSNLEAGLPSGGKSLLERIFPEKEAKYLKYESEDGRKLLYYSYQSDGTTGEKTLKHWTIYRRGEGNEKEAYSFDHALLKKNEDGSVNVYYTDPDTLKNQEGATGVDTNLLERAQRVLAQDQTESGEPDAIIPAPYVLDKDNQRHDLSWEVSEDRKSLSVIVALQPTNYPLALDPTLSFTAPAQSNTGDTIVGEASSSFGYAMTTGDFNNDGRVDLVVSATGYNSNGRVYIFYSDSSLPNLAISADIVITGPAINNFNFGYSLVSADFNADGRVDLAVGSSSWNGRVYVFYNDSTYPTAATSADAIITDAVGNNGFGTSLASVDFNLDGKVDLVVGANGYSGDSTGRVYVFYSGNITTEDNSGADYFITGNAANDFFGKSFTTADFNNDGKIDLAISSFYYSSGTGRVYLFYLDGSVPTSAATADLTITGVGITYFGYSLASGDFNNDGKIDLVVGAQYFDAGAGRVYIFYNDGSIPTSSASADVFIDGYNSFGGVNFGFSLAVADMNGDGRSDIVAGSKYDNATSTGLVSIFYNDGSYPTTDATADVVIKGLPIGDRFSAALAVADINSDGKMDVIVGAFNFASGLGKVYIFYSQNGQVNTNQSITGGATSDYFGTVATGDWNADGRMDLAVGAYGYSASAGRVYIFNGDGQIPTAANSADVIITGEAGSRFGQAIYGADWDADGKTDLVIGAQEASGVKGRAYIFWNGSITTKVATSADVIITGTTGNDRFGTTFTAGDFNSDGKIDLVVGCSQSAQITPTGYTYIFYNGSIITEAASGADVTISGETGSYFGNILTTGDYDNDGKADLVVGANHYLTNVGRAYIFYNDGSIPTTAATADVTITGESAFFASAMASGDFDSDGRTDLVMGSAYSIVGRAYIFYNDGSIPTTAATADVKIDSPTYYDFSTALVAGDFNADGRMDFAAGGYSASGDNIGRAYIFYNDGSYPTNLTSADVAIIGDSVSWLGASLAAGDMNGDGRMDLIVGAPYYSTQTGRVYMYETRENFAWQLQKVSGTASSGGLRVAPNVTGQEMKIDGEVSSQFGAAMTTGDFNSDGKIDLAVGANNYASSTGRAYIFYNDGSLASSATSADVIIAGEITNDYFGGSMAAGDLNADGRTDLAIGAHGNNGRAYIFYNDGSYPSAAVNANVVISPETTTTYFGLATEVGDFNADGRMDFVVGAYNYGSATGRAYIFYNDGSIPTAAGSADVIITGESTAHSFATTFTSGDFNADGKTDLAVSAPTYITNTGRVYLFYNGAITTENASGADVVITASSGGSSFGGSLIAGDLNADGRTDLAVGSPWTGSIYIFYNDGTYPTTSGTADVLISGIATPSGTVFSVGDWNADGRTDLAVGTHSYSGNIGRVHIIYNDGIYPAAVASADVILAGEAASNYYGYSLASGDFNSDGKADLVVGAYGYSSNRGKVYIYTMNDTVINGEASSRFGANLISGDANGDGKTDLLVGAHEYSSYTGRVYIFYSDGAYPSSATSADVIITGEAGSYFGGGGAVIGDVNADGKNDILITGGNNGKLYIFYQDGSYPTTAATADVIITGAGANTLVIADLNSDGKNDIATTYFGYGSDGRAYLFYADGTNNFGTAACTGSSPTTCSAGNADVIVNGTANKRLGTAATGDMNNDGRADWLLAGTNNSEGQVYVLYNDGVSFGTAACTTNCSVTNADVTISGENTGDGLGSSLSTGDVNADGKADIIAGASGYSSNTGRVYLFYNDGSYPSAAANADIIITGEAATAYFGGSGIYSTDLNADGRQDLVVGAWGNNSGAGRVYTFYNDGSYPSLAASADVLMSGEGPSSYFGGSFTPGDFNADGKTDLAVGAWNISKAYLIMSEAAVENVAGQKTLFRGGVKFRGGGRLR